MNRKSLQKGFTLIELLVVVAIIGILSSIVLVSLNSARQRGRDASAKGSMSSVRAAAEIYFDLNNTYALGTTDVCDYSDVASLFTAAENQTGNTPVCSADNNSYAAAVELNVGSAFCVDSNGFAGEFPIPGTDISSAISSANGFTCSNP
jgi:prepilin-type N-terminal cleavage/methylation domain-containing protein